MIPYRRQRAIESGEMIAVAADITQGDVILARRPGAVDRTPETVVSADNLAGGIFRLTLAGGFTLEPSRDLPVAVLTFNKTGPWRQMINGH